MYDVRKPPGDGLRPKQGVSDQFLWLGFILYDSPALMIHSCVCEREKAVAHTGNQGIERAMDW